jgi:hypothetical protein
VAAAAPTQAQVHALLAAMIARLMRLFVRRGAVVAEPDRAWLADGKHREDGGDVAAADGPSALPILHLASTTYRIATDPHAGRRIATIGGGSCVVGRGAGKPLCAELGGFSLHAAMRCRADDRYWLARLCRYVARPAFADDQLHWDGAECVTFELKTPQLKTLGARRHHPSRDDADRLHGAPGNTGAAPAPAPDPLPWHPRAECETACPGRPARRLEHLRG